MKAIIVIEIDEKHLMAESNDLYDRLNGRKCELKPMPEKMTLNEAMKVGYGTDGFAYRNGWNACIDEILGETE